MHFVNACMRVFVPAYKPRIYPWLNTDEARIFDKARTVSLCFFTRLTLEGTRHIHTPNNTILALNVQNEISCVILFFYFFYF